MQSKLIRNGIMALTLILITMFATCSVVQHPEDGLNTTQEKIIQHQWRMEKQRLEKLVNEYETKISIMNKRNDSLRNCITESKKTLKAFRFKTKYFQENLRTTVTGKADSSGKLLKTDIQPIVDSLVSAQVQSDSACDSTISVLETVIINQDSSLLFHEKINNSLRELNKTQDEQNAYLTAKLNISYKEVRKKTLQNKILASGLLILSGITTSLILIHASQ